MSGRCLAMRKNTLMMRVRLISSSLAKIFLMMPGRSANKRPVLAAI